MMFTLMHPYHDVCFYTCHRLKSGWSLSLGLTILCPSLPKNKLKRGLIWPQRTFLLIFFLLSEMSSLPENSLVSLPRIDVYISPCVTEIQVAFLDEVANCDKWQQFSIVLPSTWVFLTPRQDGFSCNAIWGLKGHTHSTEVSCLVPHVLRFLWIPWIFFTKLCMIHKVGERPKCIAIEHWEMWFLISLTLISWNLAQSDESRTVSKQLT